MTRPFVPGLEVPGLPAGAVVTDLDEWCAGRLGFDPRHGVGLGAGRFAEALRAGITDPDVAALPATGAIDQFADSTALLGDIARCRAVTRAALTPGQAPG